MTKTSSPLTAECSTGQTEFSDFALKVEAAFQRSVVRHMHLPENARALLPMPLKLTAEVCSALLYGEVRIARNHEAAKAQAELVKLQEDTELEVHMYQLRDRIGFIYVLNREIYTQWTY